MVPEPPPELQGAQVEFVPSVVRQYVFTGLAPTCAEVKIYGFAAYAIEPKLTVIAMTEIKYFIIKANMYN